MESVSYTHLGFDSIADYQNIPSDFGASIGRYANRINKGVIVMDGETIQLPQNNFGHCLHGGQMCIRDSDTGHTVGGISYIIEQLKHQKYERLHIVIGMVNDKDISGAVSYTHL